ncbi:hypothetical protein WJX72_003135 [[Myrmecia] bisecta]|uniref:F-box domain-containing protein n=1 Tax=[Myrmecia] bisecta TaxID=41462 RepID=A0AAW1Q7E4_9CHLO
MPLEHGAILAMEISPDADDAGSRVTGVESVWAALPLMGVFALVLAQLERRDLASVSLVSRAWHAAEAGSIIWRFSAGYRSCTPWS